MKTVKKQIKFISILFAFLLLVQSCSVYRSESVSLEDAFKSEERVKLQNSNDEILVFTKVVKSGEDYFGIKKSKDEILKVPLNELEVKKINLYRPTLSALTIVLPLILTLVGIGTVQAYNNLP